MTYKDFITELENHGLSTRSEKDSLIVSDDDLELAVISHKKQGVYKLMEFTDTFLISLTAKLAHTPIKERQPTERGT